MTKLSDLNSAAGHFSKALELYVEARRDDGAVKALKRIYAELALAPLGRHEAIVKQVEKAAAIAAHAIEQHLNAGSRFYEINAEIKLMRECLQDRKETPTNGGDSAL